MTLAEAASRTLAVTLPGQAPSYVVGTDTYTILLGGEATAGLFALIDMHVPPGGGPGPHRHGCEETFLVMEGEIVVFFADQRVRAGPQTTVNVPAGAVHRFSNPGAVPARLLCVVAPPGVDRFFAESGVPVAGRTTPPPALDAGDQSIAATRMHALAARYGIEFMPPDMFDKKE